MFQTIGSFDLSEKMNTDVKPKPTTQVCVYLPHSLFRHVKADACYMEDLLEI
jgi:hypothetical protein